MQQQQPQCAICNCKLHREGDYAKPTVKGRSHATEHHYVAERFFGRSANRRGTVRERLFAQCPWNLEGEKEIYCYECHEELLHNPVLLPSDVKRFADLVKQRGLDEAEKEMNRDKLAGRIMLFHEVISAGLNALEDSKKPF
jgi:hypothetical protein